MRDSERYSEREAEEEIMRKDFAKQEQRMIDAHTTTGAAPRFPHVVLDKKPSTSIAELLEAIRKGQKES